MLFYQEQKKSPQGISGGCKSLGHQRGNEELTVTLSCMISIGGGLYSCWLN